MPWEKQFDTDEALSKAMRAFWARGYEATSMQDLVDAMGINRGSLYDTFGDKRSLFLQALDRYDTLHRKAWAAALSGVKSPKRSILGAFEGAIATVLATGARDGCLLVNTALELPSHDQEVSDFVATAFEEMEAFFRERIEAGQDAGEIPSDVVPADTAAGLLGLMIGLRVLSRSRPEPALLRAIARQADALIS